MHRCDLDAEDCLTDHVCANLDGARRTAEGKRQWSARCPVCARPEESKRTLSLTAGGSQRIVWMCHRGCAPADVKRAMTARGISLRCVSWSPGARAAESPAERSAREELEELKGWLEGLIDGTTAGGELRLAIGMRIWESDAKTAATKLGISRRTYYRRRPQ